MATPKHSWRFVWLALVAVLPAAAWGQLNGSTNENLANIPTLDGMGLAVLAGAMAAGGTYLAVRARARRDRNKSG